MDSPRSPRHNITHSPRHKSPLKQTTLFDNSLKYVFLSLYLTNTSNIDNLFNTININNKTNKNMVLTKNEISTYFINSLTGNKKEIDAFNHFLHLYFEDNSLTCIEKPIFEHFISCLELFIKLRDKIIIN